MLESTSLDGDLGSQKLELDQDIGTDNFTQTYQSKAMYYSIPPRIFLPFVEARMVYFLSLIFIFYISY